MFDQGACYRKRKRVRLLSLHVCSNNHHHNSVCCQMIATASRLTKNNNIASQSNHFISYLKVAAVTKRPAIQAIFGDVASFALLTTSPPYGVMSYCPKRK